MKGERTILHCDLNNFYVSVACHDFPELKGKPVAVGGSVEERHGIILAKSEEAKKYGVATGDALWEAKKKCPSLIIVPPDFKRYSYFSKLVRGIYERYTDLVEPFGIDECWLDVTGSRRLFGDGVQIADELRRVVKEELGLTISVGVSFNKIFAKLGSDLKKPDGTTNIPFEKYREIVWPLSIDTLLGVGKATAEKLRHLAIFTIEDLATVDPEILKLKLGKNGELLWHFANGNENSPVRECDDRPKPQSIGRSTTCAKDLRNFEEAYTVLLKLSEEVSHELRKEDMEAHGISVSIRFDNLESKEFMTRLSEPLQSSKFLAKEGIRLLKKNFGFERPLRSIGIRAISLDDYNPECQLSFFSDRLKVIKYDRLERSIDDVRERFGVDAVVRASLLNETKAFSEQSPTTLGNTSQIR